MARLPRYFVEGQAQHIIHRGNNKQAIFIDFNDYLRYLNYLKVALEEQNVDLHAYVLMTNHVHLLATPYQKHALGKVLQSIGRRYVQYFNYKYERTGTLWEGRYRATLIDSEKYLYTCMRYIELNPVRAGMVADPKNYIWSSYSSNALGKTNSLVTPHSLYIELGENHRSRYRSYRDLFNAYLDDDQIQFIRESTNFAWVLGGTKFKKKIEKLSGRQAKPKPKGRRPALKC